MWLWMMFNITLCTDLFIILRMEAMNSTKIEETPGNQQEETEDKVF